MDLPDNTTEITRDSSPICTIVKDEIDIEECASNEEQINGCCICGDVHCTNSSNGDNSSQWVQSILLFATLLQKHFPAQGGIKFDNLATCSRCEGMINGVWSLCQQIDLIKIEIQDVLEKAAQLMTDVTMRGNSWFWLIYSVSVPFVSFNRYIWFLSLSRAKNSIN